MSEKELAVLNLAPGQIAELREASQQDQRPLTEVIGAAIYDYLNARRMAIASGYWDQP